MIRELLSLLLFASSSSGQFYRLYKDGTYDFNFHTSNDIHRSEVRYRDGTVLGKYAYRAPTGQKIEVQYSAGKHGYRESRKISDRISSMKNLPVKAAKASPSNKVIMQRPLPLADQLNSYKFIPKNETTQPPPTRIVIPMYGMKESTVPTRIVSPNYGKEEITTQSPPEPTTEKDEPLYTPESYRNYYNYQNILPSATQKTEPITKENITDSVSTEITPVEAKNNNPEYSQGVFLPSGYKFLPWNATIYGALQLPVTLIAMNGMTDSEGPSMEQSKGETDGYQIQKLNSLPEYPSNNQQTPEEVPSSNNENQYLSDIVLRKPVYFSPDEWMYMSPQSEQQQQQQQEQEKEPTPEKEQTPEKDLPSGFVPIPPALPLLNSEILNLDDEDQDLDIDYRPFVPPAQDYNTPPPPVSLTPPPLPPTPKPEPQKPLPPTLYRVPVAQKFKDFIIPYPIVAQNKVLSWG